MNFQTIYPARIFKCFYSVALAFVVLFLTASQSFAQLNIIPQPVKAVPLKGSFELKDNSIIAVDQQSEAVGHYLASYLYTTYNLRLYVKVYQRIPLKAVIKLEGLVSSKDEAYYLSVTPKSILIKANGAGLFYGVQSLIQLLPDAAGISLSVPACYVEDEPRFKWRGLSLDVCRHFFTVDEVKKYIDMMGHYKLNVFHWHLTDDEGWRIQIDKYPKLTEVGARITYWEQQGKFRKLDNLIDGGGKDGFYTKDDIRSVIKYAQDRFITILPEIEMPGHSEAAIFAYPELGCQDSTGAKHRVRMLDPSENTFKFYENVLTEVIALFPNQYVHIGGDEAEMVDWLKSPVAVALMKKEHLKNEREIQSYFIKRIETFLNSKNKKLIGWDEILQGGLAPSATVMSWQGEAGGIMAAKMHHDVVMTPLPQMYFDAPQSRASTEPVGWNDPVTWQMVYNYEPQPAELGADDAKYILGAQANIWTEKIPTFQHLQYMIYPRLLAVSELTWTPKENKNIRRFETSMYAQYHLFKLWNLNARLPSVFGLQDIVTNKDQLAETFTYPLKGAHIQYSLDGRLPDYSVNINTFPVNLFADIKDSLRINAFITQGFVPQHLWQTAIARHVVVDPAAVDAKTLKAGLEYATYKTVQNNYLKLDTVKVQSKGVLSRETALPPFPGAFNTWVKLSGYLKIDAEGDYRIATELETSPAIYLDKALIIYRDQNKYYEPQVAVMHLKQGYYQLTGYYLSVPQNIKKELFKVTQADGKLLSLSDQLFHR